jgi:ribonucleoside-diphosphate reductase beta chain
MADRQAWDLAFDPATGRRIRQEEVGVRYILPSSRWPNFFSRVVAKLQWDAHAIDLAPDAAAWPGLPDERRERLTKLLAGFRIADAAVSEHLEPFGPAANNSLIAWVVFLQRRDEQRHARFFDRVAAEVLRLPGETEDERLAAARELAPPWILELF